MKTFFLTTIVLGCLMVSCTSADQVDQASEVSQEENTTIAFQNEGHKLVYDMVQKVGTYSDFLDRKNVIYTYTYQTPDGKADISTEKYIFNGELSYGAYNQHERTFPQLEGPIEQGFDGSEYWLKHNGESLTEEALLKRVAFNRPTNFYWFAMMQKLLDPGLNYEHLGEKSMDGTNYDIVKVSFQTKDDKPTDIYQLYINKETSLVDQFLFTVADFGVMDTPNLMKLQYEEVDGLLIPTKRQYKRSNWDADVSEEPWINVTWSNIKFNNELTKEDMALRL